MNKEYLIDENIFGKYSMKYDDICDEYIFIVRKYYEIFNFFVA